MRHSYRLFAVPLLLLITALAQAGGKPCEELKSEIAAKLDAKSVKAYTLDILPVDAENDQKEVGRCEGGTKKIVYQRK
ncbi:DUF1161 domain-containing protein [Nevskia sp.]|uniref:DUF1161 domain-containing protein n=1 Tax=Nevskia sp. TaxID=1929292 RepID=UPI0025F6DF25|nr:DUF1161 domain-containing protein [Nevskia sp.]